MPVKKPYAIVNRSAPRDIHPRVTPPEKWARMTIGRETALCVYESDGRVCEGTSRVIARFDTMNEADAFLLTARRAVQAHQLALDRAREDMTRAEARLDLSRRDLRAATIQWWQEHGKDWGAPGDAR